jgi:HAD superfamily hydrolase (TIGR01509 family)
MIRFMRDRAGNRLVVPVALLIDVDGTLVDTNYQHAWCWYRAFCDHGMVLPLWRLHRHVGIGGDKYVAAVAGEAVEEAQGDSLRERWESLFDTVIGDVHPFAGAHQFVEELKERGHVVVLASSAIERHLTIHLAKLGIADLIDGYTTSDDVEESKPEADLIEAALAGAGTRNAVMIGDSPWDVMAAGRAGLKTIAVRTGGFSTSELEGAAAIYDSVDDLRAVLDASPFGRQA